MELSNEYRGFVAQARVARWNGNRHIDSTYSLQTCRANFHVRDVYVGLFGYFPTGVIVSVAKEASRTFYTCFVFLRNGGRLRLIVFYHFVGFFGSFFWEFLGLVAGIVGL